MSNFFKKAAGIFVELPNEPKSEMPEVPVADMPRAIPSTRGSRPTNLTEADMDKFEKHFDQLFDTANLPGPDYYEFSKVQDQLEKVVPDEKVRFHSAYASLALNGLTKEILVDSATKYIEVINRDREGFQKAVQEKYETASRQQEVTDKEKEVADISRQIQDLTRQLTDAQNAIQRLKEQAADAVATVKKNEDAYLFACDAMVRKIETDIEKIKNTL